MIQLFKNKAPLNINFRVAPKSFGTRSVSLRIETLHALNKAAEILKQNSNGRYEIVLNRGYVNWNKYKRFCGRIGSALFCLLYWKQRSDAPLLFGSNGHEDGFSVDIQPYDVEQQKPITFFSWRNIIIQRTKAEEILKANQSLVSMIDIAMRTAGFVGHPDPREQLQMHYRLSLY